MTHDDAPTGLGGYVDLIRRRWIYVATILPGAIFIALLFAYGLPVLYRSSATLMLEQSSLREAMNASLIAEQDQQIELVQGRVMDIPTLEALIRKSDLYPNQTAWTITEKAAEILRNTTVERVDPVTLETLKKSNAFSLHYDNPNPARAAAGAQALSDLFLSYHQRLRFEQAEKATAFFATQAELIGKQLQKIDQEVAQIKAKYGAALPDAQDRNQQARDAAERDLESTNRELRSAQERESMLSIQLSALSPRMATKQGDLTDLATVRAMLSEAQQKYTPDHPDVKRLQRALEGLIASNVRDGKPSAIKADNPEYLRVQGQLDGARREVAALRASADRAREQMMQYSGFMRAAPAVEREYAELERRRAGAQEQFQAMQTKLAEARLGQQFESEQRGEQFTMVRPPYASTTAYSPNRLGLILLGLVLGMAVCAITLAIVESFDPSVRGLKDVSALERWPMLGAVPEIMTDADRRKRVRLMGALGASYVVATAIIVGVITKTDADRDPVTSPAALPTAETSAERAS